MIEQKKTVIKSYLKDLLHTKSVKLNNSGLIECTYQFKIGQVKFSDIKTINDLIKDNVKVLKDLFGIEYKNVLMQKEPSLSYNIYVTLSNRNQIYKKYLKYFIKEDGKQNKFMATLTLNFSPKKNIEKKDFFELIKKIVPNGDNQ